MQSENLTLFKKKKKAVISFLDISIPVVSKNFAYTSLNFFSEKNVPCWHGFKLASKIFQHKFKEYANLYLWKHLSIYILKINLLYQTFIEQNLNTITIHFKIPK